MAKPTDLPEWATDGGAVVTEPSLGKKQSGWLSPEKPSDGVWNWVWNITYQWLQWLDTQTDGDYLIGRRLTAGTGITLSDNGDNTQLLSIATSSFFGKVITATTTTAASYSSAKKSSVTLDCTAVTAGNTQLLVDGTVKETLAAGAKTYRIFEPSASVSIKTLNNSLAINACSYASKSFSVASEMAVLKWVCFKSSDGTKMYAGRDIAGGTIREYNLGTGWDVSTAVYNSVSADISAQTTNPKCARISADGTKLFILAAAFIYEYTLNTPWSLASITFVSSFSLAASGSSDSVALDVNENGTKFYVMDTTDKLVRQYDLATAWNLSTISYASKSFSFNSQVTQADGLMVRSDGAKFYVLSNTTDIIYQYSMTGGEITTGAYDSLSLSVNAQDSIPVGCYMRPDFVNFYVAGNSNLRIFQYTSGTAFAGSAFYHVESEL